MSIKVETPANPITLAIIGCGQRGNVRCTYIHQLLIRTLTKLPYIGLRAVFYRRAL
jgi:hypothetical protein